MDKVAIITASRVEPSVSINRSATVLNYLYTTLPSAVLLHRVLSTVSVYLCLQAYTLAAITFTTALWISRVFAFQAYMATKLGAFHAYIASAKALAQLYRSKTIRVLRKKLFFEFAVFILGGYGNGLFLLIFWPGWLVIGGTSYALWQLCG
jgi:hypothetical protein